MFPGEKILLDGQVHYSSLLPVWLQIEVPLAREFYFFAGGDVLSGDGGLLWRGKTTWSWELTAPKRGCYQVGPLNLITGDLLGFFQQKKVLAAVSWITVFPRIIPLNPLPVPLREFFGEQKAKNLVEDPVYPIATRDYRPGRPARHIHWKASLRYNILQEKVFESTSRTKIFLVIDVEQFQSSEDEESFEAALEVAASLAVLLDSRGSSIGLVSNGLTLLKKTAVLPLLRGETHLQLLLETLAALRMEAKKRLTGMLRQSYGLLKGSSCLYFAFQSGKETRETAEIFQQYNIPVVFIVKESSGEVLEKTGHRVLKLDEIHCGSGISG